MGKVSKDNPSSGRRIPAEALRIFDARSNLIMDPFRALAFSYVPEATEMGRRDSRGKMVKSEVFAKITR